MPTPHGRVTIITPPDTEVSIADIMKATGHHKSAVLKEALDLGLIALKDKHQLTSSKRVSEMTEEQLRAIVRQEVAAVVQISGYDSPPQQLQRIIDKARQDATKNTKYVGAVEPRPIFNDCLTDDEKAKLRGYYE